MPAEGNGKKTVDGLSIIQTLFAIITPIVLGVGGWYVNDNLVKLRQPLEQVEKMTALLDRVADSQNNAKAKMAAHALYLITRDDPELLVRMLMSANRKELVQVLEELAVRDSRILPLMKEFAARHETASAKAAEQKPKTEPEKALQQVLETLGEGEGWCFLGKRDDDGYWSDQTLFLDSDEKPESNREYIVVNDVWLRKTPPEIPSYKMGEKIGVVRTNSKIKVKEIKVIKPDQLPGIDDKATRFWGLVKQEQKNQ
jgi:hypothetical protein